MANFPLAFNTNETILNSDEKAAHAKNSLLGYNVIFGTLWLTSQRIVFQSSLFGSILAYPLSHTVNASRADVHIYSKVSAGDFTSTTTYDAGLHVEFDNGGKEYFIPKELDAWAAAIQEAKSTAPDLPYSQMPPRRSAVEEGKRGLWVILGIMAGMVLLFFCIALACLCLPFVLSLLGGNSG